MAHSSSSTAGSPAWGSARRSARVEGDPAVRAGYGAAGPITAPESKDSPALDDAGAPERRERTSRRQLADLAASLSGRDQAVLRSVATFGFLTTDHLETLHFHDHTSPQAGARITRRVLARLRTNRLLEPLDRRIGGIRAGSASYVWRLGAAGDRLLRTTDNAGGGTNARARRKEPSLRFLQHRLAVADCHCALVAAGRVGRFELLDAVNEPTSWRDFTGLHGGREILKPDLYAITASGDYEDHWFIEIDRGTESLPTVLKQCLHYEHYRRSGSEQQRLALFPRVLWIVPDQRRADGLQQAIRQARDLDANLFRVECTDQLIEAIAGGAL